MSSAPLVPVIAVSSSRRGTAAASLVAAALGWCGGAAVRAGALLQYLGKNDERDATDLADLAHIPDLGEEHRRQ